MDIRRRLKLVALAAAACLPPGVTPWVLRSVFGYRIGRGTRIGLSIIEAADCEIGESVNIGHGNVIIGVRRLCIGDCVNIGFLNVIRGGDEVVIGDRTSIIRMNVINSIVDPVVSNPTDPRFVLGSDSAMTTGHRIDFTDRVTIGDGVIVAGRRSSVWTHERQQTRPVSIGTGSYIGSEVRMAPGASIPDRCVVGMGAVVVDAIEGEEQLVVGVPAKATKPLGERGTKLLGMVGQ